MTTTELARSSGVRPVLLDGGGITLSALLAQPYEAPRATIVALHGAGMSAGYFDGQATAEVSLLSLGARLGYTVLAVDRPGYGHSSAQLREGQSQAAQARTVRHALAGFAAENDLGAGILLLGHSFGGMLALRLAAVAFGTARLLGVDISGCGHRYARQLFQLGDARRRSLRGWGPPRLYPLATFRASAAIVAPTPVLELAEAPRWPMVFPRVAAKVAVPVRCTFAEHEGLWRQDPNTVRDMAARFTGAPCVAVERQAGAGHNISLSWAARAYHLRVLGFLEDCLHADDRQASDRPIPRVGTEV
ncbi:alpha/beta fold hydrolase [Nocardia brasiliensis]|uniref:2-succinyl-6-hydroxy-2, 4-cyclohexadiene-1-carboxylate synthase n=1 Tax=Nocardia brasiliensis TaxID=37326 RepID=A0A6C0QKB7_NOCBR|nr:alpha/beta hydrolase [Nocardia brasiliensis]QHZ32180.1 2-succinyl-6-hydroxy-2,4-cyclohexadiene-1-carboxylate synthase [Nocardia brasiliensis]QIS02149.1 alpha/beta fold hydrolase [Nocardia brasiliensis]